MRRFIGISGVLSSFFKRRWWASSVSSARQKSQRLRWYLTRVETWFESFWLRKFRSVAEDGHVAVLRKGIVLFEVFIQVSRHSRRQVGISTGIPEPKNEVTAQLVPHFLCTERGRITLFKDTKSGITITFQSSGHWKSPLFWVFSPTPQYVKTCCPIFKILLPCLSSGQWANGLLSLHSRSCPRFGGSNRAKSGSNSTPHGSTRSLHTEKL
jgi:hypothetical protein